MAGRRSAPVLPVTEAEAARWSSIYRAAGHHGGSRCSRSAASSTAGRFGWAGDQDGTKAGSIAYIRRNHNLLVGRRSSAERIKEGNRFGPACRRTARGGFMEIKGRDPDERRCPKENCDQRTANLRKPRRNRWARSSRPSQGLRLEHTATRTRRRPSSTKGICADRRGCLADQPRPGLTGMPPVSPGLESPTTASVASPLGTGRALEEMKNP